MGQPELLGQLEQMGQPELLGQLELRVSLG
jgi:hypothetical protein